MYSRNVLTICATLSVASVIHGYSSGPPNSACSDMLPRHGFQPQSTASSYVIRSANKTATPGDIIEVRLVSQNRGGGGAFKGFFIRAAQNKKLVAGLFRQQTDTGLRCGGAGLTHSGPQLKTEVAAQYKVPDDIQEGELFFVATVVERKDRFWTKILSDPVRIVPAGTANTNSGSTSNGAAGTTSTNNRGSSITTTTTSNSGSNTETQGGSAGTKRNMDNGGSNWKVGVLFLAALGLVVHVIL